MPHQLEMEILDQKICVEFDVLPPEPSIGHHRPMADNIKLYHPKKARRLCILERHLSTQLWEVIYEECDRYLGD